MNESPPNEVDQAEEIVEEWEKKLEIDFYNEPEIGWTLAPSRVILAMSVEIDRLEDGLLRLLNAIPAGSPHRFVNLSITGRGKGMNFCAVPGCSKTIAGHDNWI